MGLDCISLNRAFDEFRDMIKLGTRIQRNSLSYSACVPIQTQENPSSAGKANARKPIPIRTDHKSPFTFLIMQRWMFGVYFQQFKIFVGNTPNVSRQGFIELPECRRRPIFQRSRSFPAATSAFASAMKRSSFPASASAIICRSQSSSRYSAIQSASLCRSSGASEAISRSIFSIFVTMRGYHIL
jgi:hypothetical protein